MSTDKTSLADDLGLWDLRSVSILVHHFKISGCIREILTPCASIYGFRIVFYLKVVLKFKFKLVGYFGFIFLPVLKKSPLVCDWIFFWGKQKRTAEFYSK